MRTSRFRDNFLSVAAARMLNTLGAGAVTIALARSYNVDEFGTFMVAQGFLGSTAILFQFGIGNAMCYEIAAAQPGNTREICAILASGLRVLLAFTAIAALTMVMLLLLLGYGDHVNSLVYLLFPGYFLMSAGSLGDAIFRGIRRMQVMALTEFLRALLLLVLVSITFYLDFPLARFAVLWSLCQLAPILMIFYFLVRANLVSWPQKAHPERTKTIAKRAIGIGLDDVVYRVGANLTNVLLPLYITTYDIGIFNAALKPFVFLALGSQVVFQSYLPHVASSKSADIQEINCRVQNLNKMSFFFAAPLMLLPLFFPEAICTLIFGEQYLNSAPYMRVLGAAYLIYYTPPVATTLKALGHEWRVLLCSILQIVVTASGIVLLVPKLGITGATIALTCAHFIYWATEVWIHKSLSIVAVVNVTRYLLYVASTIACGSASLFLLGPKAFPAATFLFFAFLLSVATYWSHSELQSISKRFPRWTFR